jgi:hypothetical protein
VKTIRAISTAAVLGLLLGGCLQGGSTNALYGYVRFVNVSPGADSVTVTSDGATVVSSLAYGHATPYLPLGMGNHEFKALSTAGGTVYADAQFQVNETGNYTYFLYGGGSSTATLFAIDGAVESAAGYFSLRGINLATGIGALDVYLLAPGAAIDTATPAFGALAAGTKNTFTQFAIGDYNVVLTPAGTKEVVYDSGTKSYAADTKVSLLVIATGSGRLVNGALLVTDSGGTTIFIDNPRSRFRFVDATTDVPAVDVLVDGAVALANAAYGSVADYATLPAGSRSFRVEASSAPGAYLYDKSLTLNAGYDNSLVAYSIQGTGSIGVIALQDNNLPPASGKAKLRIVNAGSDDTAYDAYVNGSTIVSTLVQGTASAYQELAAGTYTVTLTQAGTSTQAAEVALPLDAGHVTTLYTYGRSGSTRIVPTTDY